MFFNFLIALACLMVASADFSARAWRPAKEYPDQSDFPEVPYLSSKPNTAIGFTGGGSRAYIEAIGELAALHQLGLMKNVRYVGGISGGAWATMTYSYVQNVKDDTVFLGPILNPEDMTEAKLKEMDPNSARRLTDVPLTLIAVKAFLDRTVKSIPDAWAYAVSKTYLEPVGIPTNKHFSWNADTVQEILSRNPQLKAEDFTTIVAADRPFPVIGTSLVGPSDGAPYVDKHQNYTLLEITPLYIGQMRAQDVDYHYSPFGRTHTRRIGGMLESFAWSVQGSSAKQGLAANQQSGLLSVPVPDKIMDIQMSAGASSYAPGSFVESLRPEMLANALGMHFDYWSPTDASPKAEDTLFADGGAYENIPLISYLQRRVSKIVLFFNSEAHLAPSEKYNPYTDPYTGDELSDCLTAFFGVMPPENHFQKRSFEYEMNQVFATSDYAPVVAALQAAQKTGNGIMATFNLTTVENKWWGIPAGITSQITFFYVGRLSGWEAKLSADMRKLFVPSDPAEAADLSIDIDEGPFRKFPHYATLGGEVNNERANALADLTGWAVLQNADAFRQILS